MEMKIEELVKVEYQTQRVLTTKQIADAYETTHDRISHNFSENKEYFVEGIHFFRVVGKELRELKEDEEFARLAFSKNANVIYLWTVPGIILHAKMLNTQRAWEIFSQIAVAMQDSAALEEIIFKYIPQPEPKNDLACVYILELSDLTVKIGMTNNLDRRQLSIRCLRQLEILREYHTDFAPRKLMLSLERAVQRTFKNHLAYGSEYFNITFEEAVAELVKLSREVV